MKTFQLRELSQLFFDLVEAEESFRWHTHFYESTNPVEPDQQEAVNRLVQRVSDISYPLRFPTAFNKAENSYSYLHSHKPNSSALENELRNLRESLVADMDSHSYLYVEDDRKRFLDNPAYLGKGVLAAFPSAEPDIRESGNCLAAECNTAAVFHLMRVVEWGLRTLCSNVGLVRLKKRKGTKTRYTPIPYSQWEDILNQLPDKVDAKLKKLPRGKSKQEAQEFYLPILQDIRAIRDAWRNHVMHTRAEYSHEDADAILAHVKRTMRMLATGVSEV